MWEGLAFNPGQATADKIAEAFQYGIMMFGMLHLLAEQH
jgi:hypothetical protein